MNILEQLASLQEAEDEDTCFILAGLVNIYTECLRRKHGRNFFSTADIRKLLLICKAILEEPVVDYAPRGKEENVTPFAPGKAVDLDEEIGAEVAKIKTGRRI